MAPTPISHAGGMGTVVIGLILTLLGVLGTVSPVCSEYVVDCAPDPIAFGLMAVAGVAILVAGVLILRKTGVRAK